MENNKLGSSIAVMNAKGGVGKSTVTLAIAETLSYYYGKKVLVIDSDAQMSISVMLMPFDELNQKRTSWKTLVGLLHQVLILGQTPDWKDFVTANVSDVDDTQTIDLLPGDLRLTLVERAVTEADRHEQMRSLVRSVLAEARLNYDYILIDCPPGLSLLTEIWLREADYHLAPVKPDFLAIAGLEMFREFKKINPDLKMAENLGILVNMKNRTSAEDDKYHNILAEDEESRCFPDPIPHMAPIQHAARFNSESRSFAAKYPGSSGESFRNTVHELLRRTDEAGKAETAENSRDESGDEIQFEPGQDIKEEKQPESQAEIEREIEPEIGPEIEPGELLKTPLVVQSAPQFPPAVGADRESLVVTPKNTPMTGAADIASRFAPEAAASPELLPTSSDAAEMVAQEAQQAEPATVRTPASRPPQSPSQRNTSA